jgi:hypothetical protein
MRPLTLTLFVCLFTVIAKGQETSKQVYEADHLKDTLKTHKLVAILPFDVSITYKRPPKNFDAGALKDEEKSLAKDLQSEMFTYLLRKKGDYTVSFQDPDKTNALLKTNNLYDDIDRITADSLARILKVDAVIKCAYSYTKTATEGGAIAKTVLFGGIGAKTASGELTMQIKNGSSGDLLWRFVKKMDETAFSSAGQLMERMMRKVSRNFPYEK